jgi:hypothetical protein
MVVLEIHKYSCCLTLSCLWLQSADDFAKNMPNMPTHRIRLVLTWASWHCSPVLNITCKVKNKHHNKTYCTYISCYSYLLLGYLVFDSRNTHHTLTSAKYQTVCVWIPAYLVKCFRAFKLYLWMSAMDNEHVNINNEDLSTYHPHLQFWVFYISKQKTLYFSKFMKCFSQCRCSCFQ